MPLKEHFLHTAQFIKLKGLTDCTISFDGKRVTGLFGANGNGKSTVLHAIAASFKPMAMGGVKGEDHRFTHFFKRDRYTNWNGCSFSLAHSYVNTNPPRINKSFSVTNAGRWMRDYDRRPSRNVFYIGINTCMPDIEKVRENLTTVYLVKEEAPDAQVAAVASGILTNRSISTVRKCKDASNKNNSLLISENADGTTVTSLRLGAGEQRLMRILKVLIAAPKYSLILIDELDLTLHTAALSRLMDYMIRLVDNKELQVIFTSHREELLKREDINIRHLYQAQDRTLVFDRTTPECLDRLSGNTDRPLSIFVEDDYAAAIVATVAKDADIRKRVCIYPFGAINNAFTVAVGMYLRGESLDNSLFVTDGDRLRTAEERRRVLDKVFSGTEPGHEAKCVEILSHFSQFMLPENVAPEEYAHNILCNSAEDNEIVRKAKSLNAVLDKHMYINLIIEDLGCGRSEGIRDIVNEVKKNQAEWDNYTSPIKDWLLARKAALGL